MRLHNILVDWQESEVGIDSMSDNQIFQQELTDSGSEAIQVGNDNGRPRGNISNASRSCRDNGWLLRNNLYRNLAAYDMHRPLSAEWTEDSYSHVARR